MTERQRRLGTLALVAGLAWLVAYPLLLVALESVRGPDGFTLAWFQRFAREPREW